MNQHTDDVTDDVTDDITAAVDRAFSAVDLDLPVERVVARGRRLRTRRHALAGGVLAVAAAVAVVVPLARTAGSAGPAPVRVAAPAASTHRGAGVQVDLAAYSVHTNADGTVTVTVKQLVDPAGLRATLAQAGIPAVVSVRQVDTSSTTCDNSGTQDTRAGRTDPVLRAAGGGTDGPGITIRPSAIPAGDTIGFVVLAKGTHPTGVLIALFKGTPPTCNP